MELQFGDASFHQVDGGCFDCFDSDKRYLGRVIYNEDRCRFWFAKHGVVETHPMYMDQINELMEYRWCVECGKLFDPRKIPQYLHCDLASDLPYCLECMDKEQARQDACLPDYGKD